jgi:hypothetical protein
MYWVGKSRGCGLVGLRFSVTLGYYGYDEWCGGCVTQVCAVGSWSLAFPNSILLYSRINHSRTTMYFVRPKCDFYASSMTHSNVIFACPRLMYACDCIWIISYMCRLFNIFRPFWTLDNHSNVFMIRPAPYASIYLYFLCNS